MDLRKEGIAFMVPPSHQPWVPRPWTQSHRELFRWHDTPNDKGVFLKRLSPPVFFSFSFSHRFVAGANIYHRGVTRVFTLWFWWHRFPLKCTCSYRQRTVIWEIFSFFHKAGAQSNRKRGAGGGRISFRSGSTPRSVCRELSFTAKWKTLKAVLQCA